VGLPLIEVPLPFPCSNADYEARMSVAMGQVRASGAEMMVFGDLFLDDVRAYREARLHGTGVSALFPLWGRPTDVLAQDILAAGFVAHVVTCDPKVLPASFAGRRYDASFLADLPAGVDPCGERGEFHTAVTDGPIFAAAIAVRPGEVVLRDGFTYADLIAV
jgi:diphthamide synthase (EF-2-diphthine--ammonia ligase)